METTGDRLPQQSRQRYANLLCDFMFKRAFGSEVNKDILIGFLNMVLEDADIKDVEFIPNEHTGMTEEDRTVIFDIYCRCHDGKSFIIEMQKGYQRHFRERALYYTTYPINKQGRDAREAHEAAKAEGKPGRRFRWDYALKPVTVVAVLDFLFEHSIQWPKDRYHSSYRLLEETTYEPMTDVLRFVFLELGRFRKRVDELDSKFDKWMFLLRHIHEMDDIPAEFDEPVFRRLFLMCEIANFTPEEYRQYLKSLENMGDYYNIINTAAEDAEKRGRDAGLAEGIARGRAEGIAEGREEGRAEGIAEGRAEGLEQGHVEAKIEMANKLKALGVDIDTIVKATGLDRETVEKL